MPSVSSATDHPHSLGRFVRSLFAAHPKRQLRELYGFMLLFAFAAAMITVFEPIYFYQLGFPVWRIALYYALHYTIYIFLMPLGARFAGRHGFEQSITVAAPIIVVYFIILANIDKHEALWWLAILVLTTFKIFFWPAYHSIFATYTDGENRGTEQSWVRLITYGAGTAGPIIAGFVAGRYGFSALFLITSIIVALAGATLLRTREEFEPIDLSYRSSWDIIKRPRHRRMVTSMLGWGEDLVYLVLWPVFMFVIISALLGSTAAAVERIGIIVGISTAIATMFGFFVGEISDRIGHRRMLRFVVPVVALSYIGRLLAHSPLTVQFADVIGRVSDTSSDIPFVSRLYRFAKQTGPLPYAVAFEQVLAVSKAAIAFIAAALFFFAPLSVAFPTIFLLAAALSLLYLFL